MSRKKKTAEAEMVAAQAVITPEADLLDPDPLHNKVVEFGLALPNGVIVWGEYHGYPFYSEPDRHRMLLVLKKSAEDIGFNEQEFLKRYVWITREVVTDVSYQGALPIDSPLAVGVPIEDEEEVEPEAEEGDLS